MRDEGRTRLRMGFFDYPSGWEPESVEEAPGADPGVGEAAGLKPGFLFAPWRGLQRTFFRGKEPGCGRAAVDR